METEAEKTETAADPGAGGCHCQGKGAAPEGVIVELTSLPPEAILSKDALGGIFGVTGRTIDRMVKRHELPPGQRLARKRCWLAGRVLAHITARAGAAEKAEAREAARLRSL